MKIRPKLLVLSICLFLISCSTVTIRPDDRIKQSSGHTIEKQENYFLFGLVGEHHVNVQEACAGKSISQAQAHTTFIDGLLGVVTLGIYTPRSYRLWCQG